MSHEKTIEKEINDSIDPIINAYHKQMQRTIHLAEIIGNCIGHLRCLQSMSQDSSINSYIDGAIADIQKRFNDEK